MMNKKILIVGLGISGVAAVKALNKLGAEIVVYDGKSEDELAAQLEELKEIDVKYHFNNYNFDEDIDLCIKSPGISMNTEIMKEITSRNIEVVSDLEAAYRISKGEFIAITGTNGKTTTTTLVGKILSHADYDNKVTGNIGYGVFYDAYIANENSYLVTECSSFQLENTLLFKPHISIITNLSPDHIDWHENCENYYRAKLKVANNQDENDYCIVNYEDDELRNRTKGLSAKIVFFSSERVLKEGLYVEDDFIYFEFNGIKEKIMNVNDIFVPGKHNLENCLAAIAVAKIIGVNIEIIKKTISEFKGVEHRLEFVAEINGIKYFNDSKGTNPDASIKAIKGMKEPVILIAGGYDKNSDYTDFIKSFDGKVKKLILMGQTKDNILETAIKMNFNDNILVESMDEAVKTAISIAEPGDTILLSPACASWDMYKNYGIRGRDFKERVVHYGKESRKS